VRIEITLNGCCDSTHFAINGDEFTIELLKKLAKSSRKAAAHVVNPTLSFKVMK